jgi:hypothetical protein
LYEKRDSIEKNFGEKLIWQRLDEKKSCRVASRLENVDVTNLEHWEKIKFFHCEVMPKFYEALKIPLMQAVKEAK